ncbi:MAG: tetratricopeptide repeat protein [bacterium]|nr:tetratricopeptide repeat protein [bacterium]
MCLFLLFLFFLPLAAAAEDSQDADYYADKGVSYYQGGKYKEAAIEWEKALNLNPNHKLANYYIIKAAEEKNKIDYYTILGMQNYDKKEIAESLDNFKTVFEYDVENQIATKYVTRISGELEKDVTLRTEIINKFKKEVDEIKGRNDLLSIKKSLAVYNTVNLLTPQDKEIQARKTEYEKKVPDAFRDESVKIYIQIGEEYFKDKKYDEAIFIWRKTLVLAPGRTDLEDKIVDAFKLKVQREKNEQISKLMKEAMANMETGLNSSAITIFEEVLRLDPNNTRAGQYRAQLIKKRAEEDEKKNLELQVNAYLDTAKKYFMNKDYENAKKFFNNVLTLDKMNKEALDHIAQCDQKLREQAESMKVEEINIIQKLLEEGIINYKLGNFEQAIAKLTECLRLSPDNKFVQEYLDLAKKALWVKREEELDIRSPFYNMINNMIKRGKDLFKKKDYEKSIEMWKSILFIFPLNRVAREYIVQCSKFINPQLFTYFIQEHIEYGKKYLEQGLPRYALNEFELVKKLFPEYEGIDQLINMAKPKEEIRTPGDPKMISKYYNEGLAYYNAQKFQEAIKSWEKVLALDPTHQKAVLNINKVNHILNYDTIKEKREKTLSHEKEIETYYLTGLKYYNSGDLKNAIRMWEQVLKLEPDNIKAKNNIRTCTIILNRY